MPANFPSNPSDGQTYTFNNNNWYYSNTYGAWLSGPNTSSIGYTGSAGAGYTGSAGGTGFTGSSGYLGSLGYTGSIGFTGSQGPVSMPTNIQGSSYVLVASDDTKLISTSSGVTVDAGVFTTNGATVSVYNSSTSASLTITQGTSVTLYLAGTTTTGSRTLANQGLAAVVCVDSINNKFVVTGSGVT